MPPKAIKTFLLPSASSQLGKKSENTRPWKISNHNISKPSISKKGVELTLRKIQRNKCFSSINAIRIDGKRNRSRRTKRTSKTNNAKEYGRDDPVVPLLRRPSETHQSDTRRDRDGYRHNKSILRLINATVATRHEANDEVRDFAGNGGAENTTDKRGEVYETSLQRGEVVCFSVLVDEGDGFGEDDEPADG